MCRVPMMTAAILAATIQVSIAQTVRSPSGETTAVSIRGEPATDFANARPLPLPRTPTPPPTQLEMLSSRTSATSAGQASASPGKEGGGRQDAERVPTTKAAEDAGVVTPQEFGSSGQPYTTSVERDASASLHRRAGRLFFKIGQDTYLCSASLIKRGLVVTSAHCVTDFGSGRFFKDFEFIPGYESGKAPFGRWSAREARVLTSYLNGSDECSVRGIVCANDVAVIVLKPKRGKLPGDETGWFGFGVNGFGFSGGQAMLTALGYPGGLNNGERQIRTDSQGGVSVGDTNNTVIGSLADGGSSGGPWLLNFGARPKLTGVKFGSDGDRNIVVGTTSWGYVDPSSSAPKQQGASPFTSSNITSLVNEACAAYASACE